MKTLRTRTPGRRGYLQETVGTKYFGWLGHYEHPRLTAANFDPHAVSICRQVFPGDVTTVLLDTGQVFSGVFAVLSYGLLRGQRVILCGPAIPCAVVR